jgi:hypothetical protein
LVCCTKKNLATLSWTRPKVFFSFMKRPRISIRVLVSTSPWRRVARFFLV